MLSTDYLPNPGGVAAHVYGLSRGLKQEGHEVVIFTVATEGFPPGDREEGGLRVVRCADRYEGQAARGQAYLAARGPRQAVAGAGPGAVLGA